MTVAEARLERRELDPLGEQPALLSQVTHRVLGERLERLGHPSQLVVQRTLELGLAQHAARGEAGAVAEEAGAPDRERLALRDFLEQGRPGRVDHPHAAPHE